MHRRVLCGYRGLQRDALCGTDRAGEVGDDAVAGCVKTRARARRDHSIDETRLRGTDGSNPSPSSGESSANQALSRAPTCRCAG
jgi:hypothetical protein